MTGLQGAGYDRSRESCEVAVGITQRRFSILACSENTGFAAGLDVGCAGESRVKEFSIASLWVNNQFEVKVPELKKSF